MASLSLNLKTLMSLTKINASELARRTGIAQPIIHRLSTGQNTNPKLATIKPIAHYFMVNVSQLIGEDPLPNDLSPPSEQTSRQSWNRVPLISWKDAISWHDSSSNSTPSTYVSTDANVSKLAYSLVIQDSTLEPLFPDGTTIIVEPKRKPNNRDFVVVRLTGENEAKLRQFIIRDNDSYLKPLSANMEDHNISPLNQGDQFLGVMMQAKVDY